MYKTKYLSDSIVGSLCREIEYIKSRSRSINSSISNCQSISLIKRLKKELICLNKRLNSIQDISQSMLIKKNCDQLSIEFLIELSNRKMITS